jgi:inhibin beta
VVNQYRQRGLNSCCIPTKLSSISMLYSDDKYIFKRDLPNVIVEQCGCS